VLQSSAEAAQPDGLAAHRRRNLPKAAIMADL